MQVFKLTADRGLVLMTPTGNKQNGLFFFPAPGYFRNAHFNLTLDKKEFGTVNIVKDVDAVVEHDVYTITSDPDVKGDLYDGDTTALTTSQLVKLELINDRTVHVVKSCDAEKIKIPHNAFSDAAKDVARIVNGNYRVLVEKRTTTVYHPVERLENLPSRDQDYKLVRYKPKTPNGRSGDIIYLTAGERTDDAIVYFEHGVNVGSVDLIDAEVIGVNVDSSEAHYPVVHVKNIMNFADGPVAKFMDLPFHQRLKKVKMQKGDKKSGNATADNARTR